MKLRVRVLAFEALANHQKRAVDGDRIGRLDTVAMVQSADDLSLAAVGDDRFEFLGEEQKHDRVSKHAVAGELGGVQPRRELPGVTEKGFTLTSIQREPIQHGDHEEVVLHPGVSAVGPTRVEDARAEHDVLQEVMAFREVSP